MLTIERPTNQRVTPDSAIVWQNDASVEDTLARELTHRVRGAEFSLLITKVSGLNEGKVRTELLTVPAPVTAVPASWHELAAHVFGESQPMTAEERVAFDAVNRTYARPIGPVERRSRSW